MIKNLYSYRYIPYGKTTLRKQHFLQGDVFKAKIKAARFNKEGNGIKKGYKFEVKYPRRYTDKMKAHLDAVRPSKGHHVFKNLDGRPTKENLVAKYRKEHPEATRYRCAQDTGMDYKTVCKWWD